MEILKTKIPKHITKRIEIAEIYELDFFLTKPISEISDVLRLATRDVTNLISIVSEIILNRNFVTVKELQNNCKFWAVIKFGCPHIDSTLNGIPIRGVTELFGESGTGKTQIALHLALQVQRTEVNGGLEGGTVYISTEEAFPSKRLQQMVQHTQYFGGQTQNLTDHIFVEHIRDIDQLKHCIGIKIPVLLSKTNIKLIIIDSIAGVFRFDTETKDYISRSEDLKCICTKLINLSMHYSLVVVCINQVTSDMKNGVKPCLGLSWSNLIRFRLKVEQSSNYIMKNNLNVPIRRLKVIFAPDLPTGSCQFIVTNSGIEDFIQ